MRKQWRRLAVVAVAFAFAGVVAAPAYGTLTVDFDGNQCADGAGCDGNATVDVVTITSLALGTVTVNSSGSTSNSPIGTLSFTMNGTPSATGPFVVKISDTDFNDPPVPLTMGESVSGLSIGGFGGPTATLSAIGYFGATNVLFDTTGPTTGVANTTLNAAAAVASSALINVSGPLYSLTQVITIDVTALGTGNALNFQANGNLGTIGTQAPVPEPASVALLGGVLLLTTKAIRRRMRKAS